MSNNVKFVTVFMKHNDAVAMSLEGENHLTLKDMDSDYLPYLSVFGGDETDITIDNETGQIVGWKPITVEQWDEYYESR